MIDTRLVGYWSDERLYLGDMEANGLGFRADGSGFTYWTRIGAVFEVGRFAWRIDADGRLQVRFVLSLSGTWTVQGDEVRHRVDSESPGQRTGVTAYTVESGQNIFGEPATLLRLHRAIGLGGPVFAMKHGAVDDPTVSGTVPCGRL